MTGLLNESPDDIEKASIRALRSKSNEAIARRDVSLALTILHDDVKVITSGGEVCTGAISMGHFFESVFADPRLVSAIRRTSSVEINGATAAEQGTWEGNWRPDLVRGVYLARWQRDVAGWRVTAELFIPLSSSKAE